MTLLFSLMKNVKQGMLHFFSIRRKPDQLSMRFAFFNIESFLQVSLHCLWLPEMARDEAKLESLFYEPFTIEHEKLVSTNG